MSLINHTHELPSHDFQQLHKYFTNNKYFVSEYDRLCLESYVVKGIPPALRRKYWMAVSGAYGYMKHYGEGYYQTLVTDDDEVKYPTWPNADY